ncbi:MAG: MMPL family transporter [Deltaproteobacteria bacterium]|nr:MMPL family transporter [Deltaproteobacteria bacterium]
MIARFFSWVVTHRAVVIGAWLAVSLASLPFALQVKPDFAVEQFFPRDPEVRAPYERFKQSFPEEDARVAAFLDAGEDGLDPAELAVLEQVAGLFGAAGLTDVVHVGTSTRLVVDTAGVAKEGPLLVDKSSKEALAAALAPVKGDALYRGLVLDESLRTFTVLGTVPATKNTEAGRAAANGLITEGLARLDPDGARLSLSGLPILRARYLVMLQQDQGVFVTVAIVVCFALLYAFYRSAWQTLAVILAIVPAYLASLVGLHLAGRPLTALTSIVPVLLLVVGISDSAHLLTEARRRRLAGEQWPDAVAGAFSHLALPCLGTAVSTAIGFFAVVVTRIGIVVDFGVIAGASVLLTWLTTMLFVPAFLALTPHARLKDGFAESKRLAGLVHGMLALAQKYPRALTLCAALALAASIPPLFTLRVDSKMIDERDEHALMRDIKRAEDQGFAMFQLNVLLEADDGRARTLLTRELRAWMAGLQERAVRDVRVTGSLSPRDFAAHAFDAAFPGESSEGAFADLVDAQLVDGLLASVTGDRPGPLRAVLDPTRARAQVLLFVRDAGSAPTGELLEWLDTELRARPPPGAHAVVTGTVVLAQRTFDRLVTGFLQSLGLSTLLIFLVLLIHFRSVGWALLGMLPNVLPLLALLGALAAAGQPITPTLVLVFSVATGLVVDDTIHLHLDIQRRRRAGTSFADAMLAASRERGPAIVQTALVLTLAFASLVVSQFKATYLMGQLLAGSLAIGLVAELVLFPAAVLALSVREKQKRRMGQLDG